MGWSGLRFALRRNSGGMYARGDDRILGGNRPEVLLRVSTAQFVMSESTCPRSPNPMRARSPARRIAATPCRFTPVGRLPDPRRACVRLDARANLPGKRRFQSPLRLCRTEFGECDFRSVVVATDLVICQAAQESLFVRVATAD